MSDRASNGTSGIRKRLQDHWGKFEYNKSRKIENASDGLVTGADGNAPEVIDLTSDREVDDGTDTSETDISGGDSSGGTTNSPSTVAENMVDQGSSGEEVTFPFRLIKSEIYDKTTTSEHFITLEQIFGHPDLSQSWLFSFQYELDYILPMFHEETRITIVAQKGTILPVTQFTPQVSTLLKRMKTLLVYMPPYACHHSKMIVNQYKNGDCQIFIPSNNFTSAETNIPQQIVWCGPRLKPILGKPQSSLFGSSLLTYLKGYRLDLTTLISALEELDFKQLDDSGTDFVFAHPEVATSGLALLNDRLQNQHHAHKRENYMHHYLCQVSTIGSPVKAGLRTPGNLFTHLMIPLFSGLLDPKTNSKTHTGRKIYELPDLKERLDANKIKTYIIYPTDQEIRKCPMGYMAGGWFHHHWMRNETTKKLYMTLKNWSVFYKLQPAAGSLRGSTPSHTKFYMKSTTSSLNSVPFEEVDWLLFTTGNLSFNAWGSPSSKPRNYEVGVLLTPRGGTKITVSSAEELVYGKFNGLGTVLGGLQLRNKKKVCVMVPFNISPAPYSYSDDSFCISSTYKELDTHGHSHQPQD